MMGVQERLLAIRLSERLAENEAYAQKIGVSVVMRKTDSSDTKHTTIISEKQGGSIHEWRS